MDVTEEEKESVGGEDERLLSLDANEEINGVEEQNEIIGREIRNEMQSSPLALRI